MLKSIFKSIRYTGNTKTFIFNCPECGFLNTDEYEHDEFPQCAECKLTDFKDLKRYSLTKGTIPHTYEHTVYKVVHKDCLYEKSPTVAFIGGAFSTKKSQHVIEDVFDAYIFACDNVRDAIFWSAVAIDQKGFFAKDLRICKFVIKTLSPNLLSRIHHLSNEILIHHMNIRDISIIGPVKYSDILEPYFRDQKLENIFDETIRIVNVTTASEKVAKYVESVSKIPLQDTGYSTVKIGFQIPKVFIDYVINTRQWNATELSPNLIKVTTR